MQHARLLTIAVALFWSLRVSAIEVIVPERGNLQYLVFWVAQGAGYIDAQVRAPDSPGETRNLVTREGAHAAVLPPPLFFQLVGDGVPLVAVANLLRHDAINLVVRQSVAVARKLDPKLPLREKLERMRGLKLGVAPGPVTRLDALFKSAGIARTVEVVTLMGQEQNQALADGRVDALYSHTPYLERALLQQDCVVIVNQAGGEVPELAQRQIHMLAVTEKLLRDNRPAVDKLIRGIARAQTLIRTDRAAALKALLKAVPGDRALTAKLLELYTPAIPETPAVSVEGLRRALTLYPASKRPPDLSGVDFQKLVLTSTPPRR
jgi:ABC-type nitrate/sulfonate/bicarbonate transport system substrate-binding protein